MAPGVYKPLGLSQAVFPMAEHWCNGQWLDAVKYPGASQDRGAFLGLGLFETMLGVDGRLAFAARHLARLRASGGRFGWDLEFPELPEVAAELLVRNGLDSGRARLRLVVTAGSGLHNDLARGKDCLMWLSAFPSGETPESVSACISPWPRNERSPLAGLKTACYAENLMALDHARQLGFDEAIFLNMAECLCEAATSNVFLVKNGTLLTPSLESGCLPGVGREVVCELARAKGRMCEEKALRIEDLETADEIFLSSATRGPVPVCRFGDKLLPIGPVTGKLRLMLEEAVLNDVRG